MALNPGLCFSIIFHGDWTLDLMMTYGQPNITRDEVLDALDRVIQTYQAAKRQVSNEVLLLRYVWLDADKVSINRFFRSNDFCQALQLNGCKSVC